MRALQFWLLLLCSCFVCFLYFRQIFLERELDQQQRLVVDSQEAVTEGDAYENAWKQLAMSVYQNSRQDPAFAAVLKTENVEVRPGMNGTPPPATNAAAPPAAPGPSTPLHPANP